MKIYNKLQACLLYTLLSTLLVACGGGGSDTGAPSAGPETLRSFVDNQPATARVLGNQFMIGNPAMGPGGKLYLPTYYSIQVFNSVPTMDTTLSNADIKDIGITRPFGGGNANSIAFSGEKMIVAAGNSVMIWNTAPTSQDTSPDVVLTRTSVDYLSLACPYSYIQEAQGVKVLGGNLVVADSGHNRILIYRGIPTSNADLPAVVLGDSNQCPDTTAASPTASTLNYPVDVAYDGEHLIVADTYNNRLLMWVTTDLLSLTPGQTADIVLGQSDFVSTSTSNMYMPYALSTFKHLSGTRLALLDTPAVGSPTDRIRIWDTVPTCTDNFCVAPIGTPHELSPGTSYGLAFTGLNQLIVNEEYSDGSTINPRRFSIFNAP
jgi:NHL repeat